MATPGRRFQNRSPGANMRQGILVAANRDKQRLLTAAADLLADNEADPGFGFRYYSDDDVLRWVLNRDFRCFCPASAFSIPELEQRLAQRPEETGRTSLDLQVFAATPIVLMMSRDVYRSLEEGGRVGWQALLSRAAPADVMHAHIGSADGLAVMTAISAAARRFVSASVEDEHGGRDEFVRALEEQVLEYAPDDASVVEHGLPDGRWRAGVLALREDTAYATASRYPGLRAVVVHPADGTAWAHFVLGRLTRPQDEDDTEQAAFTRLAEGLQSPDLNHVYLSHGVRPIAGTAGASVRPPPAVPGLNIVGSPGTPPRSPPARRLLRTIRKRAATLKRSADVCLVLDVSGSMSGHRLAAAKRGLLTFLDRLAGPDANVGAVFFADRVSTPVALQQLSTARTAVRQELARVDGGGGTALLDGVHQALEVLDGAGAARNLKAMIVLTDGEENSSARTLGDVERRLSTSGYLFFGIAYGGAAGRALLETLARGSGGHSLVTDEGGIEAAYELLSQHM